eukprot:scaffold48121_cov54-Cyclotella_meneghiniana.AAC.5
MLLARSPHIETGDIHKLSPHANVTLTDKHPGMVDALGESLLEDFGLKTTLEELLGGELQYEIQLEFVVGEEAVAAHTTEEGGTLEDALGILGIEC